MKLLLAILLLVVSSIAFGNDKSTCENAAQRLLREARALEQEAGNGEGENYSRSERAAIESAIANTENALSRVKRDCEYVSPMTRFCAQLRAIRNSKGKDDAYKACIAIGIARETCSPCIE